MGVGSIRCLLGDVGPGTEKDQEARDLGEPVELYATARRRAPFAGIAGAAGSASRMARGALCSGSAAVQWTGAVLAAVGVGFAIWARRHLGTNWSGVVTLKEGHELIRTGPYRRIRHPIYTGMLLALFGTVIEIGRVAGLIAFAIAWASFTMKARREESFLAEEFGEQFDVHRKESGMFLPKHG